MQRTGGRRSRAHEPVDDTLERDAAALYQALTALIRVYQFRDKDSVCHQGLSVSQCYALKSIAARPGLMLQDLARDLRLDKSTTSRVVAELERKAQVRRWPNPDDSRAVMIEPTPGGRRLLARIEGGLIEEQKALLAGFPEAVRRDMTRLLRLLARAAEARTAAPPCAGAVPAPAPRSRTRRAVPRG